MIKVGFSMRVMIAVSCSALHVEKSGSHLTLQLLVQVVGVKSREILLNAGNIHCITQQCPAAQ